MTFIVGLTGGIGSGKSVAAKIFEELGAAVIDTDGIARQLTRPGEAGVAAIRRIFGDDFIAADGSLDRAGMRRRVFSDPAAKQELEAILHPLIRHEVARRAARCNGPYLIIVVPLLIETGGYGDLIQRVLVVDCAEETQVTRTVRRSNLTGAEVRAIMATQASRAARLAQADDTISNDGDMESLKRQVEALHRRYLELAQRAPQAPISTLPD